MRDAVLRFLGASFLALFWNGIASNPALAQRRVAFVIGINDYVHLGPEAQLKRAVNDAESVGDRLEKLGFIVTKLARGVTVDQDSFFRRFANWVNDIRPGDVAFFYFAGHGVGMNGANYLVPEDIPDLVDTDEFMFRAHALSEADVRNRIIARGASVTVLMLDACRNNPFNAADRAIAHSAGLERVQSVQGVLTIYAAGYGQTALDGLSGKNDTSSNSVFTGVVVSELEKPGVNLIDFSEDIRDQVSQLASLAGHVQVPAVDNRLVGGRFFYLSDAPHSPDVPAPDQTAWGLIKGTRDPEVLRRFVNAYPLSSYKGEAGERIASIERSAPATSIAESKTAGAQAEFQMSDDEMLWLKLARSQSPQNLRDFLSRFPESRIRPKVEARLRVLDESAWIKIAANDRASIDRYLDAFPEGAHRKEADARIASLDVRTATLQKLQASTAPLKAETQHVIHSQSQSLHGRSRMVENVVRHRLRAEQSRPAYNKCFSFGGEQHCQ